MATGDGGDAKGPSRVMSYHDRLVHFYTEHNPSMIPSIESLLRRYKGEEEALIQSVHIKYDVRDLVSDEAVDDIFENERYSYLTMSFGSTYNTYPGHLLVLDRKRWSAASGKPSSQDMHEVEPTLPDGYEWTGQWTIDSTYVKCDKEGWTYAFDFSNFRAMLLNDQSHSAAGMTDYVRRRRWIRPRRRRALPLPASQSSQDSTAEMSSITPDETTGLSSASHGSTAPTAPPPPSPYRHFAAPTTMSELQASWILHLRALKSVHSMLHHARAARVLRWRAAKAQLQAQLTELASPSQRLPHNQSKLDILKRAMWFPVEKGYIWRASLAGVFVGLQDFWVERLALTFQLHFTDPTRLEATFQGAFCGEFHGIKVKGDKGTRIPNAKWSQVASDFEFRGRWALLCEKEPTGWTLDQAKSTPVDFTAMNMQYRGGLGIPDALVQLILQDLVTNYITDIVAKSLPPELNKLMLRPTSGIEVAGELVVDGLDLAATVHSTLCASSKQREDDPASQVLQVLNLTRPQLNLLLSTRQYNGLDMLFPSLAQFTRYVRLHALDPRADDQDVVENLTKEWIDTWDRILELLQLQRQLHPCDGTNSAYSMAPISFEELIQHTKRHVLQKQLPVRVHLNQLNWRVHVPTMLHTLSTWLTNSATRVSTSAAAKVMGIRLGRKKEAPRNDVAPSSTPAFVTIVLDRLKRFMESGLVRLFHTVMEGKVSGIGRASTCNDDDALLRLQLHDVQLNACGPLDWSTSFAWTRSVGRCRISTIPSQPDLPPNVTFMLEPRASVDPAALATSTPEAVSATLTNIQSSLVLDTTHVCGEVVVCATEYGRDGASSTKDATNLHMQWHPALVAKLRVGSIHATASLRALFQVSVDAVLETLPFPTPAKPWLDKIMTTVLKYCASDALMMAWSVGTSLDDDGMWTCHGAGDHPQPFLAFDQLHLLTLLHDVDDLVAFAIQMHDSATETYPDQGTNCNQ
ncbi:hypothetical protein H310_05259 [Aphanomyces invadans]|uniref:Peroxin/Ferlin domain-containing protein n=1 Tax=Aphanomyces invadans TaxID=157072 RepID=A0A024U8K3_9STRA|nr:hypothetical protein H310_05259 [Aphanomyces invadans]ETW02761.1 hypothetical protein H310_05259 [Aphanomyces invadans]|eukprot:XP_008868145.1 hypothetical protein H310_05259 [Aphanomyces invadans]